jgi:hypothetical protein
VVRHLVGLVGHPTGFVRCDYWDVDLITSVANLVRNQGLEVDEPVNLRSTNNVVAWMHPSPVVVKIAGDFDSARRELHTATFLVSIGAPVVPPIEIGIAQPVNVAGRWATFWHHVADGGVATAAQVAASLDELHAGLAKAPGRTTFPPCWNRLETAVVLLEDSEISGRLTADDHSHLRRALLDGIAALTSLGDPPHVLHGSPHRFNILVTGGTAVFIDFETVEQGPLEWDVAHLDQEVAALYPADLDEDLLRTCRIAISAATATWCWHAIDRGADMRTHAEQHLDSVRRSRA